ncbi:MAG: PHP domain-containing protein [Ruminococcaceae bacterium]|nr:PHP domain-containing protein [Oscillospiraceae bacterium]
MKKMNFPHPKGAPSGVILDMHIHTDASPDSNNDISSLIRRAVSLGINGFAVCDHNKIITSEKLKEKAISSGLDKELGIEINPSKPCKNAFYLIGGGEYAFEGSHVLGIFIDGDENVPQAFGNAEEYISFVKESGGYTVLAHPYEHLSSDKEPRLSPEIFDFIEAFNGRAGYKHALSNTRAARLAEKLSSKITAGSDAHFKKELGNGLTLVENDNRDGLLPSYDELKNSFFENRSRLFRGKPSPRRVVPKSSLLRAVRSKSIKAIIKASALYLIYLTRDLLYPQKETEINNN